MNNHIIKGVLPDGSSFELHSHGGKAILEKLKKEGTQGMKGFLLKKPLIHADTTTQKNVNK